MGNEIAPVGPAYYDYPALKAPVWTWEVPAYFFVGGTAGAAALIGAVARRTGGSDTLVRDARWIAAAGAALSPPLLISDLGRPERFLNMLRVFKVRSPMSVGAWTLVAFSNAAAASAFADLAHRATGGRLPVSIVSDAADLLSAGTGLVLSTYTGVLLGATAIPVWSANATLLPLHFGASGLASAVSILELLGHRGRALNALGIGTAAVETAMAAHVALSDEPAMRAIKEGGAGALARAAGVLSGPVPLILRICAGRSRNGRRAAAIAAIAGSILTRAAWVAAGKSAGAAGQAIAISSRRDAEPPA
ncbi:MAG TPA: NrfD/PsrC family molybdoenzyme membrane anchor subunit [Vicinamibacterales bacterium]|nr:NrfD/PsrC family molybdoenzyme membrane anchor subunit [Vicinamibacterales bacterium]